MNKKISIRLKEKEGRIDKVLNKYFPEYTRSKIQIWIKNELITVNDKVIKPSYMVKNGDQIVFNIPKKIV